MKRAPFPVLLAPLVFASLMGLPPETSLADDAPPLSEQAIADTVLHPGHLLVALLDAYEALPDPFLAERTSWRAMVRERLLGRL